MSYEEGEFVVMNRPEAYPIAYGVLGLLAFWGPMSGYDLKRLFDHTLAPMWAAAHSQIYKELRRMKDLDWVAMEREKQETRPDRKIYQITQAGREALAAWQAQPPEVLQLRDDLLLKMVFGSLASPEIIASHLRTGIASHEQRLLRYRQNRQHLPSYQQPRQASGRPNPYASQSEADPYLSLVARFAIAFEKTYLDWLYESLATLEKENP